MALFVDEKKLRSLITAKFRHGIPYWHLEKIVEEIIEECKRVEKTLDKS